MVRPSPRRTGTTSRPPRRPASAAFSAPVPARPARCRSAQARFEAARAEHQRQEAERRRALAVAKAKYDRKVTEERAKAAARNAYVTSRQSAFAAGDPEAVQWFVGCLLRVSRYPDGFPREYQVSYDPGNRDVAVDLELPPRSVVPAVRALPLREGAGRRRAGAAPGKRDQPGPRTAGRLRRASRAARDLRRPSRPNWSRPSHLTGWVSSVDPATGAPVRPRPLAVRAERPAFDALVLDAVDPIACLDRLNTLTSPA